LGFKEWVLRLSDDDVKEIVTRLDETRRDWEDDKYKKAKIESIRDDAIKKSKLSHKQLQFLANLIKEVEQDRANLEFLKSSRLSSRTVPSNDRAKKRPLNKNEQRLQYNIESMKTVLAKQGITYDQ
jgi:hypothetical protein